MSDTPHSAACSTSPMNNARTKKQQADWTGRVLLGLILGSVLFCATLLAFPIWSAITQIASQQVGPHRCATMSNDADRLECYDREAGRSPTPPAKGANPPAAIFGR
jgi:hypothetical protein